MCCFSVFVFRKRRYKTFMEGPRGSTEAPGVPSPGVVKRDFHSFPQLTGGFLFLTVSICSKLKVKELICHCICLTRSHAATCILSTLDCKPSEFLYFLLQHLLQSFHLLHIVNYNVVTDISEVL